METHEINCNADRRALAGAAGKRMVVGAKQLRKAIGNGSAKQVFLARNADPAITEPLAALCRQHHIDYAWVPNMLDLGKACGIEVGAAAAAAVE